MKIFPRRLSKRIDASKHRNRDLRISNMHFVSSTSFDRIVLFDPSEFKNGLVTEY